MILKLLEKAKVRPPNRSWKQHTPRRGNPEKRDGIAHGETTAPNGRPNCSNQGRGILGNVQSAANPLLRSSDWGRSNDCKGIPVKTSAGKRQSELRGKPAEPRSTVTRPFSGSSAAADILLINHRHTQHARHYYFFHSFTPHLSESQSFDEK